MAMAQTPLRRSVKLDEQVIARIKADMKAQESYNEVLRRLLGLDAQGRAEPRERRAP